MAYNRTSKPYPSTFASPPVQTMSRYPATATSSDSQRCSRCLTEYSLSKHGSCLCCHIREGCRNPDCSELAYFDVALRLGSFSFCSRNCRDQSELPKAREALEKSLKDSERPPTDLPDGISRQNNLDSPPAADPSSVGVRPGNVLPQSKLIQGGQFGSTNMPDAASVKREFEVSVDRKLFKAHIKTFDDFRVFPFDEYHGVIISNIKVEVTSQGGLAMLRPLDIVTHVNNKDVGLSINPSGRLYRDIYEASTLHFKIIRLFPAMPPLKDLVEKGFPDNRSHHVGLSRHVVGIHCDTPLATLSERSIGIGLSTWAASPNKIVWVSENSKAHKCGLEIGSVIESVAIITEAQISGPKMDWSFNNMITALPKDIVNYCILMFVYGNSS